jgi:ribonuclease-3
MRGSMGNNINYNLIRLQEILEYKFNDSDLLIQALTTAQFGKENDLPSYEILETLGDAILKLILSLRLYYEGIRDPGILTKRKQMLESNSYLIDIAQKINLDHYILTSKNQRLKNTTILADVLESICAAIYLDSRKNLEIVETKIITKFFTNWDEFEKDYMTDFSKNELLEYFQKKLRYTPKLEFEYQEIVNQNAYSWIAKNLKIVSPEGEIIFKLPETFCSRKLRTQKDAEKELCHITLKYLRKGGKVTSKDQKKSLV